MDITFCTFFYDIGRSDWDVFNIHSGTYMYWFENVLSLDINLYIQTEEKFLDVIREKRKAVDPEFKKTIIKTTKIEHLEAWKRYNNPLEELMSSENFKSKVWCNVPEMTKPLYNVLMFNKVHYLKEIIEQNPFNTKFFSWVDTGFIRNNSWILNNTEWPQKDLINLKPNKVRFFCINDDVTHGLSNTTKESHCMSQMRYLKGTIFFLDGSCINKLCDLFDKNVKQCLAEEFIGSDEKIFDLCYVDDPELFELVKCDWRAEFHLYSKHKLVSYDFNIDWKTEDITKVPEYSFWYIGVEDDTTAVVHRADIDPSNEEYSDIFNFKQNSLSLSFTSTTRPTKFVIWPVDKNGKWLDRIEYPLFVI